ncbi:MAG TPA: acyl-CoA dehydrogenase family protein [Nitriliruptorales bacterium]
MAEPGVDLLADDEDLAALRSLARELADKELAPRAAEHDEDESFPDQAWKALAQAGLFGVTVGERWGGAGMGDRASAVVLEELARADVSAAIMIQLAMNGAPRAVEHLANDTLKDRWLPRAASGEDLFCIGITESEAGSATQNMLARLEPDGDGWRLHAYKNYVTGGHRAGACLVWARWPGGEGANGIGGVLVDLSAEGVSVTGIHRKMGLRAMAEAELAFDGVAITPDDVVIAGDPANHDAFRTLLGHLNHERAGNAAMCIGAAQGALEHAVRYANERILNGRPIAELQGIQWKFADMAIALESARLLLYRAVSLAPQHGTPPALETAMAKTAANEAAKLVCDEAIQVLGGYGYSREYPVERMYRDIRGLCIGAGTVEVQRNYVGSRVGRGSAPSGPAWRNPVG